MSATRIALALGAALSLLTFPALAVNQLRTHSGQEVGLSFSHYQYKEPDLMKLEGNKFGIDYTTTLMLDQNQEWFMKIAGRYAFGDVNYDSVRTGSNKGEDDWYTEIRALFGKDLDFGSQVLAPFSGLGFRYLDNDGAGITTTTGHYGYGRTSNYVYLPIGAIHRISLNANSLLETTLEADFLLYGKQKSYLSGATIENKQKEGYGFRLSSFYRQGPWAIGPYYDYWKISKSETDTAMDTSGTQWIFWEPKNNTNEYGIKASYRF